MDSLAPHLHHLDRRLRLRLRIYFVISSILLLVILYDMVSNKLPFVLAVLGILGGVGVGIISSRMFHISWDKNATKMVSRLDEYGIVILVLYIIFELKREWVVSHFVQGTVVATVSFAVLTGVMIGRLLGTRGRILRVLKEQKVF